MTLDTLRTGRPEQMLAGRYSFRTRGRDGLALDPRLVLACGLAELRRFSSH
jgi:hypothetical protein